MPSALHTDRTSPLLDREFLHKLERLALSWNQSLKGRVGGRRPAPFAGAGQEFLDHRNFHPGDDLRNVNWQAYMRFEKFFLRTFQVEPRVPIRLLLDVSASMNIEGEAKEPNKFTYLRRLVAALVYIGLVRLDKIEIQPFADDLKEPFLCSGGRHQFQPAEAFLRKLEAHGPTDYERSTRHFLNLYPQRGLVIIVSDFLGTQDCLPSLQLLSDFGHELLLLQLWNPAERQPELNGQLNLVEIESGGRRTVIVDEQRRLAYTLAFDRYAGELQRLAERNSGRYWGLATNTLLEEALFGEARLSLLM